MDPNRLKEIPIFSHLSDEEAKRLAAFASETSVAEGQILMKQGDYSTELIGIQEGTADVLQDGKKIASLKQGDLIGEMGLLSREPRNADVIATSPMRLLTFSAYGIGRLCSALPSVRDRLLAYLPSDPTSMRAQPTRLMTALSLTA